MSLAKRRRRNCGRIRKTAILFPIIRCSTAFSISSWTETAQSRIVLLRVMTGPTRRRLSICFTSANTSGSSPRRVHACRKRRSGSTGVTLSRTAGATGADRRCASSGLKRAGLVGAQALARRLAVPVRIASQVRKELEKFLACRTRYGAEPDLAGVEAFARAPLRKNDLVPVEQQVHIFNAFGFLLDDRTAVDQMLGRDQYLGAVEIQRRDRRTMQHPVLGRHQQRPVIPRCPRVDTDRGETS